MTDWAGWVGVAPVIAVAVAWTVLPGLAVTYALGLRGVTAWGVAPVAAIGSAAVGAVAAGLLGVPWSAGAALAPAVLAALLAGAARLLGRARRRAVAAVPDPPGDGVRPALAATAGLGAAGLLGMLTVGLGMNTPARLSQTYDAVFHYSAVTRILSDGSASSLVLGRLTSPSSGIAFYPAAWHDLVSLVVLTTGASVPVAANAVVAALACVVWPLACTALVRVVCGPVPAALVLAPILAVGFIAFPWSLMGFGVLWPNLTGLSLVPAALAVVLSLCRLGPQAPVRRGAAVVLLAGAVGTLGLAHPNALFSLAVLALFPVAWVFGRWVLRQVRARRLVVAAAAVAAVAAGLLGTAWFLLTTPALDDIRTFDWPAYQSPLRAAGEVALGSTNDRPAAWALAVVVLLGLVAACATPDRRWLVPAHVASGALFVLASSQETEFAAAVTAFWYNDSYRLAAVLPVTAVPLGVIGILAVGSAARAWGPRATRLPAVSAVALGLTAVSLVGLGVVAAVRNAAYVRASYPGPQIASDLVTPQEIAFYERAGRLVETGSVVAQNPWSGSALLWPLTGREVLFPHLTGDWSADQTYLAQHLRDAAIDPRVCAAANRLDVRYLLTGTADFWLGDSRARGFPGLDAPAPGSGFRLLAADAGGDALYALTACDDTSGAQG